jgi:hypothetical protein
VKKPQSSGLLLAAAILVAALVGWLVFTDRPLPPVNDQAQLVPHQDSPARVLSSLHPGMSQPEVEMHLKDLQRVSRELEPVDFSLGFPAYRVRYRVNLLNPIPNAKHPEPFRPGMHVVTLLFDARQVGHPLVSISSTREEVPPRPIPG